MKYTMFIAFLLTVLPLQTVTASANHDGRFAFNGFSGGMTLHCGYLWGGRMTFPTLGGDISSQNMRGVPIGIGGSAKLHFGNHLRIGAEGYSTKLKYGDFGSSLSLGWGGLSADWQIRTGKFLPYAGITLGGGSATDLVFAKSPVHGDDTVMADGNIAYRKYGFAAIVPFIGVEFEVSRRMRLVLKADWLIKTGSPSRSFPSGPRIYFGFSFYHAHASEKR